jgi:methylthioribose-1-phosphate isomerase
VSEPVQPPDPTRRLFFRQFARDAVTSVGSVLGAAQTLQQTSADAARELLGTDAPADPPAGGSAVTTSGVEMDAATAGWRAPFRWDGDVCRIVDQRRLPDVLVDLEIRGAGDAVGAINEGALVGSAVQAQVAAVTLAIVGAKTVRSRAFARRATIRGAASALRLTRPGSAQMVAALDRMLALLDELGLETEGDRVAAELAAEAERIIGEAIEDHGLLVGHVLEVLPGAADAPLHVLVAGHTGAMGGGQFGTALSAVQTVHHTGRPVHALLPEGRPGLEGARVAAWELRQAGVPHAVVTDAAAPACIANGEVEAVLVGADRIAANGDVVAPAGAYPLALACAAAAVPFIVCAATTVLDPDVATGGEATIEEGRPGMVLRAAGTRIAPEGTQIRNPLQDLVPAGLVTAIVTEAGVLRAPYGPGVGAAAAGAAARRASSRGFAALLAQREAKAAAEAASPDGAAGGTGAPVDVAALRNPPREPGA